MQPPSEARPGTIVAPRPKRDYRSRSHLIKPPKQEAKISPPNLSVLGQDDNVRSPELLPVQGPACLGFDVSVKFCTGNREQSRVRCKPEVW
jgi:hypothetical protein